MILSLAPAPPVYKRRYLHDEGGLLMGRETLGFDAVVEQQWLDRGEFFA
jgi:hypothetical protein